MVDIGTEAVDDREPTPEEQNKDPAAVARGWQVEFHDVTRAVFPADFIRAIPDHANIEREFI